MALDFGLYRYNHFRGASKSYFTIEIYKKDYSDNDSSGNPQLYPETTQARDFPNNPSFVTYWTGQGVTVPGWSWSSSYGGSAYHTAGDTDQLNYVFDNSLLVDGAQYSVLIELAGITNGVSSKQIKVKLGSAVTSGFYDNGVHEEIVTATGGQLSLDPTTNFQGYVKRVELKRYFPPAEEFKTQGEGFTLTYNGKGGTRKRNFIASECKINYLVEDTATEQFLYDLIAGGVQQYYARIYRSQFPWYTTQGKAASQIFWYGYIMPAFDTLENAPFPYVFNLTANDSYGFYSKRGVDLFASEYEKTKRHSIRNILRDFLTINNLNDIEQFGQWTLITNIDWWQTIDTYGSANPALRYHIAKGFVTKPTTYNDSGEIDVNDKPFEYKEIDVFNGVLQALNLTGVQSEGSYWFFQPNSFIANTTAEATIYRYRSGGFAQDPNSPQTIPFLETVVNFSSGPVSEQTDAKILGGSTITFEPALKEVKINYEPGFSNFSVSGGQDLSTEFYAGSVQTGAGDFYLTFEAIHKENVDEDDFVFNSPVGGIDWKFIDSSFTSQGNLTIKISNGATTKYLISNNNGGLEWTSTTSSITLIRGYNASTSDPVNNPGELAIGIVSDNIPTNQGGNSSGPCQRYFIGGGNVQAHTIFKFGGDVADPGINGDITIKFDPSVNYFQAVRDNPSGAFPNYEWTYDDLNNPTPFSSSIEAVNITLVPTDANNEEDADVSNGIEYIASQNELVAFETEDLGNVRLGRNINNLMYSFQYDANPSPTVQNWTAVQNFQRGNPTPDNPFNPTQLMINEYLQMGVEPLEILQADLKSRFYAPHKLLKYSINNDTAFKYYMFLGGTYKAASEVWSGEWYKVSDTPAADIISETPVTTGPTNPGPTPGGPTQEGKAAFNNLESVLYNDALGVSNTAITHSNAYTKINFATTTKGKVYNGQKLVFSYPDGSNSLVLTVSGDQDLTVSAIDVASFTPKISYPIGSILRPLIYDFTNVITGGGSSLANLYQGITTTYIELSPQEFHITSHSNLHTYTRDNLGSVQPSSFINRSKAYATCFIPLNYKMTAVDIHASVNRNIRVLTARITNDTTTLQGSGTSNTTLTLSTAWTSVAGEYIILEFEFGASTDEIRGAKITIQAV